MKGRIEFLLLFLFNTLRSGRSLSRGPHRSRQPAMNRRALLMIGCGTGSVLLCWPLSSAVAGELGARITKAVTQSDLGISVRRSVVQGAQTMDRLDLEAERFADQFGLGAARSQQAQRPKPKAIPAFQPLNVNLAHQILEISDKAFCQTISVPPSVLQETLAMETEKVRPSFARSGLFLADDITDQDQFNFRAFVHYKSYSSILLDGRKVDFATFKKEFEGRLGQQLCNTILPSGIALPPKARNLVQSLDIALQRIEMLSNILVANGFVAQMDRSSMEREDIVDWSNDSTSLTFSIALDNDSTLQSQMLLQETGLRLYPSLARVCIQHILSVSLPSQTIEVDDYYMDTDYNSDPDKFEVKEVLLNVVLDST